MYLFADLTAQAARQRYQKTMHSTVPVTLGSGTTSTDCIATLAVRKRGWFADDAVQNCK